MKKCSKCKIFKELNEFGSNKSRKDGLNAYCKVCVRIYDKRLDIHGKSIKQKYNSDYNAKYSKLYITRKQGRLTPPFLKNNKE